MVVRDLPAVDASARTGAAVPAEAGGIIGGLAVSWIAGRGAAAGAIGMMVGGCVVVTADGGRGTGIVGGHPGLGPLGALALARTQRRNA